MAEIEMKRSTATVKTTAVKATETSKKVRGMVKGMYEEAARANVEGRPVAYCMTGSQYDEIVRAMDIVPVWTENYAGLCAAKRKAEPFIVRAEDEGYSNVVCGYVRTGIGFEAMRRDLGHIPPDSPDGGMAMPDMMLGSSSACDPRYKWFQALGRYMKVPTLSIDVVAPPITCDIEKAAGHYVKYQLEQFRGLVSFLETHTRKKMNNDKLWETIKLGDEAWRLWYEVDRLRRAVPGPMPSEDHYNAMVPGQFFCGTAQAVAFYQELFDEVKARADNKVSVIPNERYRLLMGGGLPPWHTMWIFNYFESLGAVFVIENAYRSADPVEVSSYVKDPLEYLAWRTYLRRTQFFREARLRSGDPVVERILQLIDDYKIDGVVFHATRSCRATTVGQLHRKNVLQRFVSVPIMQLTSDIVDLRDYSEDGWKTQISTFLDMIGTGKIAPPKCE